MRRHTRGILGFISLDCWGVRGTPAFLIGRTVPGTTVTGELVIGVQPIEAIRTQVEALTKR
jgi:hypothetical protein